MVIDHYLPHYDVTEVQDVRVQATPEVTYAAIREAGLGDPLINVLFSIREWPTRLAHHLYGDPPTPHPAPHTFNDLTTTTRGWVPLGEKTGVEFVIGAVGRFWQHDYGWYPVTADQFITFNDPGYAKLAVSFRVQPIDRDRSLLRYEARTATTDADARRHFHGYWRIIHPGVTIVMRRVLQRIRVEAERRFRASITTVPASAATGIPR